jgi:hypothetical protein
MAGVARLARRHWVPSRPGGAAVLLGLGDVLDGAAASPGRGVPGTMAWRPHGGA